MSDAPSPLDPELVTSLTAALEAQQATNRQLDQVLEKWADVAGRQVLFALARWCEIAANPRNPGQLAARQLLRAWFDAEDNARRILSGLVVVKDSPSPPNGSV